MDRDELRAMARRKRSLVSPIEAREYILTVGMGGTGKSSKILDVARACPANTFYCVDSEMANFQRLIATEYQDLKNVRVTPALEWDHWKKGIRDISDRMDVYEGSLGQPLSNDWLVIDSASPSWDAVQAWFIEQIHGEDIDEWFLKKRIQNQRINESASKPDDKIKGLAALSGGDGDWQVINKQYFKYMYNALIMCPGHKYITAEQDVISKEDDREVRGTYGPYGIKPKGQKRLGYVPMTALWFTKKRAGEWYMTTIKDRGRTEVEDEPLGDFAEDYLVKLAGWNADQSN